MGVEAEGEGVVLRDTWLKFFLIISLRWDKYNQIHFNVPKKQNWRHFDIIIYRGYEEITKALEEIDLKNILW